MYKKWIPCQSQASHGKYNDLKFSYKYIDHLYTPEDRALESEVMAADQNDIDMICSCMKKKKLH